MTCVPDKMHSSYLKTFEVVYDKGFQCYSHHSPQLFDFKKKEGKTKQNMLF